MNTSTEMTKDRIQPWTGEFVDRGTERQFRDYMQPVRNSHIRYIAWFAALVFFLLLVPEYFRLGQEPEFFWLAISRTTLSVLLVVLGFTIRFNETHEDEVLFAAQMIIPPGLLLFDYIKGGEPLFIGNMMLVIVVLYLFAPNRMVYSIIVGLFAAVITAISLATVHHISGSTLSQMCIMLAVSNAFGYTAWRQFNMVRRREYFTYITEREGREQLRAEVEKRIATEDGLRLALSDAAQTARQKTGLMDDLSHELRTPLNAIIGFSDSINKEVFGPLDNERYKEYAGIIHSSGNHLLELITNMLDQSKAESGTVELNDAPVEVETLVNGVLPMVSSLAREAGVEVIATSLDDPPVVNVDEQKIRQILLNLLSNAIKFTPTGGKVELIIGISEDHSVMLAVKDNGVGIPQEDLDKVFEPFEQSMAHGVRGEAGTGLGLSLSRRLAGLHGGYISVESTVNEGSVFALVLPPRRNLSAPTDNAEAPTS